MSARLLVMKVGREVRYGGSLATYTSTLSYLLLHLELRELLCHNECISTLQFFEIYSASFPKVEDMDSYEVPYYQKKFSIPSRLIQNVF